GIRARRALRLGGTTGIPFHEPDDLLFHESETLPGHPNGLRFTGFDEAGGRLLAEVYYSVGGGFVVKEGEPCRDEGAAPPPYPFASAADLLALGRRTGLSIAGVRGANEGTGRPRAEIDAGLDRIWRTMEQCIERGCRAEGVLPGGLGVQRRAGRLFRALDSCSVADPLAVLDWVSLFALAVNEENASGGRGVTAPAKGPGGGNPAGLADFRRGATR